jgi:hypothetical protein
MKEKSYGDWVSIEDINLEGKVKDEGNIICKLIRLEGKVKDERETLFAS